MPFYFFEEINIVPNYDNFVLIYALESFLENPMFWIEIWKKILRPQNAISLFKKKIFLQRFTNNTYQQYIYNNVPQKNFKIFKNVRNNQN